MLKRVPALYKYHTGSNVLSLSERDLMAMADQETLDQYQFVGFSTVINANGVLSVFRTLRVEHRFRRHACKKLHWSDFGCMYTLRIA